MEILFNIFTQYSILVMNGCFDQNTGRKLHSLFSYHFQNIAAPFIIEACCGGFFFLTKTRTLPDLNSVNKQSVNAQTTCSHRVLRTSFGHVCLSTYCEWTADLGHTVVFIRAERRKQTWEESSRTSKNYTT